MESQKERIEKFKGIFLAFQIHTIDAEVEALLNAGVSPQELLRACQQCMEVIGAKFEAGEYFLPELVMSGEIFKKVSSRLRPVISTADREVAGKIVLGTPKGDLHHLGKDMFAVLAEGSGFEVYDLGVDVPPETFIEKIEETGAPIVGMSMLLTTAFGSMREVLRLLDEKGLRDKVNVIIGGGVTSKEMVQRLGVDAQTLDAYEGVRIVQSFMARREEME